MPPQAPHNAATVLRETKEITQENEKTTQETEKSLNKEDTLLREDTDSRLQRLKQSFWARAFFVSPRTAVVDKAVLASAVAATQQADAALREDVEEQKQTAFPKSSWARAVARAFNRQAPLPREATCCVAGHTDCRPDRRCAVCLGKPPKPSVPWSQQLQEIQANANDGTVTRL
eukprot:gnl/TRDRNA2_/TRDRNA2_155361_c0_seq1.p2 gnl/TRDRNA2_/TRDRNA2_155361_c0~~gnl/TRDRNA2_/TRDRNA2_155361_c0_seq1.p2  ORF type:complete len:174 (+),score=31.95 gnl/TRDRNA2_/TRDRNA2_155361_c0_seq1:138-659(+)